MFDGNILGAFLRNIITNTLHSLKISRSQSRKLTTMML